MSAHQLTVKKTGEKLLRDSRLCARQAVDLRQTADGLFKRAAFLERLSVDLLRRSTGVNLKSRRLKPQR